jgi:hypothetical protein
MSEVSGRWINDEEDHHLPGDLVGQPIDQSTQRPPRPAVANRGAAAAEGETPWSATEVEPPPTSGRHPLAHPGRRTMVGRARTLRTLAVDLRTVRRWQLDGAWTRIQITLQGFADAAGLITWQVSVNSTINQAHQHAAGALHHPQLQVEPPGPEPTDHGLGRSRGDLTHQDPPGV